VGDEERSGEGGGGADAEHGIGAVWWDGNAI